MAATDWFVIECSNWYDEGTRYARNGTIDQNEQLTYIMYEVTESASHGIQESLLFESGIMHFNILKL